MAAKKAVKKRTSLPEKIQRRLPKIRKSRERAKDPLQHISIQIEDVKIGDVRMDRINENFVRDEQLKSDNVMTQAQAVIYGDREKTYGRPELNLESIAQLWTVYLQRKSVVKGTSDEVTINDVCQMMVLLKTARLINQPDHHDSQVDQIGYIGLQERCRK
jgi:hypothetical protein